MRVKRCLYLPLLILVIFSLSSCSGTPALIGRDIEVRNEEIEKTEGSQDTNMSVKGELMFSEGLSSTSKYRDISNIIIVFTLKNKDGDNVQSINSSPGEGYSMRSDIYSITFPQEEVSVDAIPTDQWVEFNIKGGLPNPVLEETTSIKFDTVMGQYQ